MAWRVILDDPGQIFGRLTVKHGARNDLTGKVTEIKSGDVMTHVKVHISGEFDISSVMTSESLEALELKEGDRVHVIVKAVNVLLAKD